jgi:hypothetical protein
LDQSEVYKSRLYCDLILAATLTSSGLAASLNNYFIALFASVCLALLVVVGHNFIHQRNNWRMFVTNIGMMNCQDWRVFHAISHHMYPNSYHDMQIAGYEPTLNWMPEPKTKSQIFKSWLLTPIMYGLTFITAHDTRYFFGSSIYTFLL